jgi:hypothetical protein
MQSDLDKICSFIAQHHVLSLATAFEESVSVCSVFYAFERASLSFIVASSENTLHIQQAKKNENVAGNILLETKEVGKIQGLQFFARMKKTEDAALKREYFKNFPYALALQPTLWQLEVSSFKLTDNRFGFGKKITYECSSL